MKILTNQKNNLIYAKSAQGTTVIATHVDQSNYLPNQKQGAMSKYRLDSDYWTLPGLLQGSENCGFFQGFHRIPLTNLGGGDVGGKSIESCAPAREECNKYDLTAAPLFLIGDHNDWSRWFATGICSPQLSFLGGHWVTEK